MMNSKIQHLIKPTITVLSLAILTWLLPATPLDPWNLLSPKKIASMILALTVIQVFGAFMVDYLGTRTGAILTGFFGGLVSSTITTASLAKRSKANNNKNPSGEMLTFLAATGAMLFEGLALVITGTTSVHITTVVIFIGPILATIIMIFFQYRKLEDRYDQADTSKFKILPILKLSLFIIAILAVSKISQNFFGKNGLLVLTSLISLFEIHGSIIANVQLHEAGSVSVKFLCSLLAVSVVASYISKLFLIFTLGSPLLKSFATKSTLLLFGSLAVSWLIAFNLA